MKSICWGRLKKFVFLSLLLTMFFVTTSIQAKTSYREYRKTFQTYPYSNPNPVPNFTKFYPYFRFEGFTNKPENREWKIVELSNDYLTLTILPEIGGKIWTATEKSTGRSIFYSNPVVKFRDIAMRGPWTSGGLEANIGIIGHTPNCSSPVDYSIQKKPDGSISCFIGSLDLITRSQWTVEINLPDKCAYFGTKVFWHNSSNQYQPYYTWMNIGIPVSDDMQYINPGTNYLGHNGDVHAWPIDETNGKDISWYKNNDFGGPKSYHIVGKLAEFYGVYYHDSDFGVVSIIPTEGKRGRKIWIWGLSRDGMIWEDLLTDPPAKQYSEIQSGRLFNQASSSSSETPMKQREFAPGGTDSWEEYWMPILQTKGFNAASLIGTMKVDVNSNKVEVRLCPVVFRKCEIEIFDNGKHIFTQPIVLEPLKTLTINHTMVQTPTNLEVRLGQNLLVWKQKEEILSRPWKPIIPIVNPKSASWQYQMGMEALRQRLNKESNQYFKKCLELDPLYIQAYIGLADNANRRGDYKMALDYVLKALSIDTYNAMANYEYGIASKALGRMTDAKEAFSMAALADVHRSLTFTALAKIYLLEQDLFSAMMKTEKALDYDQRNPEAIRLKLCILRLQGKQGEKQFQILAKEANDINPLTHEILMERYLGGLDKKEDIQKVLQGELPHETCLEQAIWYHSVGRKQDAIKILELAAPSGKPEELPTMLLYWLAWLKNDSSLLTIVEQRKTDLCFPFRPESLPILQWAKQNGTSWQHDYYLAVLNEFLERHDEAVKLLEECGNKPTNAPFYIFRGTLLEKDRLSDYKRAFELAPNEPMYAQLYAGELLKSDKVRECLEITEKYIQRFPIDTRLVLLHTKALLANNMPEKALDYLRTAVFLPNEGSSSGRVLYQEAVLLCAVKKMNQKEYEEALDFLKQARQWPENLGAGKLWPNMCDERLEDWLSAQCYMALGNEKKARTFYDAILFTGDQERQSILKKNELDPLWTALTLRAMGQSEKAQKILGVKSKNSSDLQQWMQNFFDNKKPKTDKGDSLAKRILSLLK